MESEALNLKNIADATLPWFDRNKRDLPWRHDPTPYRVWISEIMLQQTRVDPVIPYYQRFMNEVPDVETLAALPQDKLMKLWEGLGYYSRARNLQKAAQMICDQKGFPEDYEGWHALPGIGEYTAGAICSIALGLPTPAVDGNVLRVVSRVSGSFSDIMLPATKNAFREALRRVYPQDTSSFTQGLMEVGALICLPNGEPKCALCPYVAFCVAKREGLIDEIPVKTEKKPRKIEDKTVFLIRCGDQIALHKRPASGLLAGLWEFPNTEGHLIERELRERFGKKLISISTLPDAIHVFTHIEWHLRGYAVTLKEQDPRFEWFSLDDVLFHKAIPSAFKIYTKQLSKQR